MLRIIKCSHLSQNVFDCFLFPSWKHREIFLRYWVWEPVELLEVNLIILWGHLFWLHPLEFYLFYLSNTEPPASQFSYSSYFPTWYWSLWWVLLVSLSLCSGKPWLPIFACLSKLGDRGLSCFLYSVPKRIVDFSLLGWSGNI